MCKLADCRADTDDVADVAVAALTDDSHAGEVYELTRPRLLTFAEAIAEIGAASRRTLAYMPVSVEEYATALAKENVPREFVQFVSYLFSEVLDGRNAHLSDGVQRALGREPRDFGEYARETASTGIWNPSTAFPVVAWNRLA